MSEHELWNEIGNLFFMTGAYSQAAHAYQRSIRADASFGRPYSNLALTYVQQAKYDEAIDLYRRSIELLTEDKEKAISWNRLGTVYRHLKDYSHAVIAFQEADELDPQSADDFPAEMATAQLDFQAPSSVLDEPISKEIAPVDESFVTVEPTCEEIAPADESFVTVEPTCEEIAPADESFVTVEPTCEGIGVLEAPEAVEPVLGEMSAQEDMLTSAELALPEPEPLAAQAPMEQSAVIGEEIEPKVEWWDVDDKRMQSATHQEPVAALPGEEANSSWTHADATQFQQDVSQMPETGSLTTWGDADFEDDFEFFPTLDPEPSQEMPEPDGEALSTWIPMPEEAPFNFDELRVPPFVDDEEPVPDLPTDWNETAGYHVINSVNYGPPAWSRPDSERDIVYVERSQPTSGKQTINQLEVDVDVEERPAPEAVATVEPQHELVQAVQTQTVAAATPPTVAAVAEERERDEDEMREIEMGIAKFRRVVQVNPRNAHAWDALGTLFKSAGQYKDAILAYQQAISNDSSKSLYYHHLGLVYACEGRDEDAIGTFQKVIEIDPEYSLAHATLGGYYRKMGLEELAQKHIGKAMKNIFDSENEYNRACLEAICGNADQAIELLGVALQNKQTYVDWILRDPDLDFIRQDPRFKQLISDYTR